MSVYHYLFDTRSGACLGLGSKVDAEDRAYAGPVVYVDGHRYLLPSDMLGLLIRRFRGDAPQDVPIVPDYELFETDRYLPDGADAIDVGGDTGGPPISDWLPELVSPEGREHVRRHGTLIA